MTRIIKLILIIISLILISGCFEYRVNATFSEDKCDIKQTVLIDKNTFNIDSDDVKQDIKDKSMIIEETDDLIILKKLITIMSDDYNDNGITISKFAGGYSVILNPYLISNQDNPIKGISLNNNFTFTVNITDGKIISHNGDSEKGDTIYFSIPYDTQKINHLPEIKVKTAKINIRSYIIAFAAILLLIITIIILKSKDKK